MIVSDLGVSVVVDGDDGGRIKGQEEMSSKLIDGKLADNLNSSLDALDKAWMPQCLSVQFPPLGVIGSYSFVSVVRNKLHRTTTHNHPQYAS